MIDEISFYHLFNLENISGEIDIVPGDEKSPYHSRLSESLGTEIVDLVHVDVLVADDCPGTVTAEEPFLGHHQVQVEASLGVGGQGGLRGEECVLMRGEQSVGSPSQEAPPPAWSG